MTVRTVARDVTDRAGVLNGYWHSLGTQTANTNNDGLQNDGEKGLNGVKVNLVIEYPNGTSTTLTTLTANDAGGNPGYYQFGNLLLDEDENTGDNIVHTLSVGTTQTALNGYAVAQLNVAGATADMNDSDDPAGVQALPVQGLIDTSAVDPVLTETKAASYDFGFIQALVDVQLTKTVNPLSVQRGQTVTYTLTASNAGFVTANGVMVKDLLPTSLSFVSATPSQGAYDAVSGNWAVGVLAPGASSTLEITVTVK